MANAFIADDLPTTSEQAIRKFSEEYLAVLSAAEPSDWAQRFVEAMPSERTTYPMSVLAGKFSDTQEGASRFTGMAGKSFDLKVSEFDMGFEARMMDLAENVFEWRRWKEAPAALVKAEHRHYASKLAAALEANGACPYDNVAMFHATGHEANPVKPGTNWGNLQSTPKDLSSGATEYANALQYIQDEMVNMTTSVLDVNGDKLQAHATEIWMPSTIAQPVASRLTSAFLANGASNYMLGKITPVEVPELTDPKDWYLVDTDLIKRGYNILIAGTYVPGSNLGFRNWDESSDFYKDTSKIKISQHIWAAFSVLFPHAIRKVKGS